MDMTEKMGIIAEIMELEADAISYDDLLSSYEEWDSLAVLSFIAVMDSRYGKVIKAAELKRAKTIRDICNLM